MKIQRLATLTMVAILLATPMLSTPTAADHNKIPGLPIPTDACATVANPLAAICIGFGEPFQTTVLEHRNRNTNPFLEWRVPTCLWDDAQDGQIDAACIKQMHAWLLAPLNWVQHDHYERTTWLTPLEISWGTTQGWPCIDRACLEPSWDCLAVQTIIPCPGEPDPQGGRIPILYLADHENDGIYEGYGFWMNGQYHVYDFGCGRLDPEHPYHIFVCTTPG